MIANHLSAWRGLNCRPKQVLITSGAWEALEIISCGILRGDRKVAFKGPGWRTVREVLGATKTKMFPIRIDKKGFEAGRIPSGLSAAIVAPCRHYPTGVVMPLSRRAALSEWAAREHAVIIEDDYDSEFRYRGRPLPGLNGLDRTIYLGRCFVGPAP